MKEVIVIKHFVWYDWEANEGDTLELDEVLYDRFKRAGYIKDKPKKLFEPIIEKKSDKDITAHKDSGIGKPSDDSVGKNASSGRKHNSRK